MLLQEAQAELQAHGSTMVKGALLVIEAELEIAARLKA